MKGKERKRIEVKRGRKGKEQKYEVEEKENNGSIKGKERKIKEV